MEITPLALMGPRVLLVPLEEEHIFALYAVGHHPEIWLHSALDGTTLEAMRTLVHSALRAQQRGDACPFTIVERSSNEIVGSTQLHTISHENRSLEIGKTWFSPSRWGTGLNTECKYLLLQHCFETLGTVRVQFRTDARNVRSQRALEKIGAILEGVLRQNWILPDGYVRDTVYYSIVREEWLACKQQLLHAQGQSCRDQDGSIHAQGAQLSDL